METETGEAKIPLLSTVPVSVTDNGFDPDVVTVTVGTTVEWTNHTQETVYLQSGEPYRIYLPLVLRNVGGAGGQAASAPEPASQAEVRLTASAPFSGTLLPGGTLTHTFTSEGDYPYFLTNNPAWIGLVSVEPIPFDFEMGATPPSHSVAPGQSVTYTVQVTGAMGDPQPVTLTVGGLLAVAAWGLNPSMVVPTSTAVLSITTALTTPVGNHTLVITGTGGGQVHTAMATLMVAPHPDFEVAVAPAVRSAAQRQSVTYTVSLTALHGFDKPVSLSTDGLPAGTAAIWSQNPLTPTDTTVLTITTNLTTPLGTHSLTLTGSGGGLSHQVPITLEVTPHSDFAIGVQPPTQAVTQGQSIIYTVYLTSEHGFADAVALTVGDLPTGAAAEWSANPVVPSASGVLTVTTASNTPTGDYTLVVTGTGGGFAYTTTATLSISLHAGFSLDIAPDTQIVSQGDLAVYTATVTGLYDFIGPVTLAVDGLPDGATATILPNPVAPTSTATITLATALTTPAGDHALTLIGTGGGRVHNQPFTLTVTPHPDFSLDVTPDTRSVRQSRAVTATVTLTALHGFAAPVALSVGGLPAGVMSDWTTNPLTPDGATVLTFTTALTTPLGSHSLVITGTGGGFIHTTPFTLTVLPHPDFAFAVMPPTRTITQGLAVTFTTHLTAENEWEGPVQLSVQGLPTGMVASWVPNPVTPSGNSLLTLTTALTTPVGNHTLVITGTGGGQVHTATATLVVTPHPDFEIAVAPAMHSTAQGQSVTYTVSLTALHGFDKPVSLSADGLPAGTAAIWSQNPLTPTDTTVLTITTSLTTPLGSYSLTVTGSGGGFSHQAPITLEVTPHSDFAIGVQPPTQAVTQGQSITYTVYLTSEHGFADAVALSVGGLPTGAAAEWNANPVVPSASGILTVTTASDTPTGDYTLVVTGTGGGFTHTTGITLTVLAIPPDLIMESIQTDPAISLEGQEVLITVTIRNQGGTATNPFQADWYVNPAGPPDVGDSGVVSWTVNGLGPGTSVVLTTTRVFTPSGDYGLWGQADTLDTVTEGNEANNVTGPVTATVLSTVQEVCGTINEDTIWYSGVVYVITCDVTVQDGVTLTVQPSVVVKFDAGRKMNINGTLIAEGTETALVVFTSLKDDSYGGDTNNDDNTTSPSPGDWGSITFNSTAANCRLRHALVRYGGDATLDVNSTRLDVTDSVLAYNRRALDYNSATGVITGTQFLSNTEYAIYETASALTIQGNEFRWNRRGIYLRTATGSHPSIGGNTFEDNWEYAYWPDFAGFLLLDSTNSFTNTIGNAVWVDSGTLTQDWTLFSGPVYRISDLTVVSGVTLTVESRAILKLYSTYSGLTVNGTLQSQGTVGSPVYFTSYKDDSVGGDTNGDGSSTPYPGNWRRIYIVSGGSATLSHTVVRYGGYWSSYGTDYPMIDNYGSLTLNDCDVRYSAQEGIRSLNGSLSITNSTIASNNARGVFVVGQSLILIESSIANNNDAGLWFGESGAPQSLVLLGNVFNDNGDYAARIFANGTGENLSANLSTFNSNSGSGNAHDAIYFTANITDTTVLTPQTGLVYVFAGVNINAGSSLTLKPGVVVKFSSYVSDLSVYGTLDVQGTAGSPVVFTSLKDDTYGGDTNNDGLSNPYPGNWRRIYIASGGSATLSHTVVRYGGCWSPYNPDYPMIDNYGSLTLNDCDVRYSVQEGIVSQNGFLSITNSTIASNNAKGVFVVGQPLILIESSIADNGGYGLMFDESGGPESLILLDNVFNGNGGYAVGISASGTGRSLFADLSTFSGNSGSGNTHDAIYFAANITDTTVLTPQTGLVYVFAGVNINAGSSLTLKPGVVVKFSSYVSDLRVYGTLDVQGTAGSPVVFTSLKDDTYGGDTNGDGSSSPSPGNWRRIYIAEGASATLSHTVVRYGGYGSPYNPDYPMIDNYGSLTLNDCDVRYSTQEGIRSLNGSLSITHSTVADNDKGGIRVNHDAAVSDSSIYGNGNYGIYNSNTSITLNAENNWWGSDSGPAPYGSGNGINYTTSCSEGVCTIIPYVDVTPWLGQQTYYGQNVPNVVYEADPVNTANGNYAYQRTDLRIPTRGLPLEFARAYNSLSPESGPLGYGWRHTWRVTAEENGDDVYITYGDGRQIRFTWDGSVYVPAAGVFSTLTKSGGVFHLTEKNQTVYHFDTQGRLASVEDKNGNTTTLTYTGDDLTTITGPASRTLTFAYTSPISDSLISSVADSLARSIHFTYNITGELTVVTDTRGFTTTYTYDADHRLLNITDANDHTFLTNEYNDAGRVSKQWDAEGHQWAFAYDEPDHDTIVTDPLGRATTYDYDAQLRLINEIDALDNTASYDYDTDNNPVQIIDKRSYTTTYAYDDRGNVTIITDTLSYTRTFTYDAFNNPTGETNPLGHTTVYTYDASSNLIARADPQGNVTTWAYDTYGQVISQTDGLTRTTHYAYDTYGHQTAITDALTNTTTFTYDLVGRKLSETDPESHTMNYTYDAVNHITVITDALSNPIFYTYDAVGNRTVITEANGHPTTYTYDEKDRLVSVTDPLSHTTTYGYDEVSNQTAVTDPLSCATTYAYDALNRRIAITNTLGNTTHYQYDANGNRTHLTDANGNATQYTYNALNRLVSVTDAEDGTVTYTYDANGNRTSMTDANDHATAYTYDSLNRLISITDPLTYTTIYTYDAVGNRVGEQKPDGTVITYTYDILDYLVDISASGLSVEYAYDTVGSRTVMTDSTGVTTYTYDALYRLTQVAATTGTLQYTYDLNGNRTHLTYPDGEVVTYTYDLANRPTTVTDWAGRIITYTYDDVGRQTEVAYPNNVQASYTYDDAGRLLVITHTSSVSGTFAFFRYSLDAVGNRLVMTDTDGVTAYAYDDLYRLVQVTYPDSEQVAYAYDPLGNRTGVTSTVSGVVTYTYDAGDRLLMAGSDTFGWDANGRMITRTYGLNTVTYTFDPLDRLTQVISGATTVQFTYNGDGVRVGKSVGGANTGYVQDVGAPLPVVLAETAGGQTSYYVYGNDLETWVDPAGNPTFYHYDGLGSTRALSNLTGQRTDAYSYDVFGAVRSHTGGAAQPFTFTGEQADDELGLVYLRARYYDPQVGRFITRDPFPGTIINPRSLNRYVYTQNNPVNLTDPNGEVINLGTAAIGAGVGALVNSAWYAVVDVGIRGEKFSGARLAGKATRGFVTGGLTGVTLGGSVLASGALRGAGGYAIEHMVENLVKYRGDVSHIGEGITTSGIVGNAIGGGVSAELVRGIEHLPGYLKPTLGAPLRQLSLFDNTYGAHLQDIVGYQISKKIIGKGFKDIFGALWQQFERDTRNGIVSPIFAPTLGGQYASGSYGGGGGAWGGPPSGGK